MDEKWTKNSPKGDNCKGGSTIGVNSEVFANKIPKNLAQNPNIKGAGYNLNEPNSAQLGWVSLLVGGEGKSTINGLSKIPHVAEIRKPKSVLRDQGWLEDQPQKSPLSAMVLHPILFKIKK